MTITRKRTPPPHRITGSVKKKRHGENQIKTFEIWKKFLSATMVIIVMVVLAGTGLWEIEPAKAMTKMHDKIADPIPLPTGSGYSTAFSSDSKYLAVGHATTPFVTVYDMTSGIPTKLSDPVSPPNGIGYGVAFSPNGNYLAVAHDVSPYLSVYDISGGTLTKISTPSTPPTGIGHAVSFSADSKYLAVAHENSPFVSIYDMTSGTPTKITNPGTLPTGQGRGVSFSPDGKYLAVAHATSPFVTIYSVVGSTFTKMGNPSNLPINAGMGAAFSPDSKYLAIAYIDAAYNLIIYNMSSGTPIKTPDAFPQVQTMSYGVSFSPDNMYFALVFPIGPTLATFDISSGTPMRRLDINPAMSGSGQGVSYSSDGKYLAIAHTSSPFITIYKVSDLYNVSVSGSYAFPTGAGATYQSGDTITIYAGDRGATYSFAGWTVNSGGAELENASAATTTFTMPANDVTVTANWSIVCNVTVNSSYASTTGAGTNLTAGNTITINAGTREGYSFDGWTVNSGGVTLANPALATTTFTMPSNSVEVTANWKAIDYEVTINGSHATTSGEGVDYNIGNTVNIDAGTNSGHKFVKWIAIAGDIEFDDATSPQTSFVMPASNVKIEATWKSTSDYNIIGAPPAIIINAPSGLTFDDETDFFEAFRIFDVTFSGDNYSYTLLPEFEDFDGYPTHDTQTLKEYLESNPGPEAMTDLATALRSYIKNASPAIEVVGEVAITDKQVTIDLGDAGYGYYLVFHSINAFDDEGTPIQIVAACALTTTDPIAEITAKADVPTLTKHIKLADGTLTNVTALSIGDTVSFVLEITLPATVEAYESYPLIIHDEIGISSNYFLGLDPEGTNGFIGGITVKLVDPTDANPAISLTSLQYNTTPAPDGFTIEFDYNEILEILVIDDNAENYTSIIVEYTTVVNQGILDMMKGTNTAWAQFGADPYSDATETTPPSTVTIFVSFLDDIYKVDGNSYDNETRHDYETYLANAEFNLYRLTTLSEPGAGGILYSIGSPLTFTTDALGNAIYDGDPTNTNTFTTLTSDATGLVNTYGLAPGLYMLRETTAPDGYNKLTYDIFFKIDFINDPDIGWTFIKSVCFDNNEEHPFLYETAQSTFTVIYDLTLEDHESLDSNEWIDNITENVFIENFSGTLFPGTGGIGTAIFSLTAAIFGSLLLTSYIISRKRKSHDIPA